MRVRFRCWLFFVMLSGIGASVWHCSVPAQEKGTKPKVKPVDLLKFIDPAKHAVKSKWLLQRGKLVSDAEPIGRIMVPYEPPEEYDLEIVAQRLNGKEGMAISIPYGKNYPSLCLDAYASTVSGISLCDGKDCQSNKTRWEGRVFPDFGEATIICRIRQGRIQIAVDDKVIVDWRGEANDLSLLAWAEVPNKKVLSIGTWHSSFVISKFSLTPVTGTGKFAK